MKSISILDRLLLLVTGLLAAYQIAVGIEGLGAFPILCYTLAFGALLVAGLLLIILGFEILDSPLTILVSTLIPLSLSLGLVAEYAPTYVVPYLIFALVGIVAIGITRFTSPGKTAALVLAPVHGLAGLLIFGMPIALALQRIVPAGFVWVGVGGGLIGVGGLLLSFLKTGRPILARDTILSVLPGLLLLTTAAFVYGFSQA